MGRKLISGLLIVTLLLGTVLPVGATDIQDAKDKEQQLEEQRDNLASEKASLSTKVKALTNSMKEAPFSSAFKRYFKKSISSIKPVKNQKPNIASTLVRTSPLLYLLRIFNP